LQKPGCGSLGRSLLKDVLRGFAVMPSNFSRKANQEIGVEAGPLPIRRIGRLCLCVFRDWAFSASREANQRSRDSSAGQSSMSRRSPYPFREERVASQNCSALKVRPRRVAGSYCAIRALALSQIRFIGRGRPSAWLLAALPTLAIFPPTGRCPRPAPGGPPPGSP